MPLLRRPPLARVCTIRCSACGGEAAVAWGWAVLTALPLLLAAGASLHAPDLASAAVCWLVGLASMSALFYGFVPLVKR